MDFTATFVSTPSVKETVPMPERAKNCVEYVRRILPPDLKAQARCEAEGSADDVFNFSTKDGLHVRIWYEHNVLLNASVETHAEYEVSDDWRELLDFEKKPLVEHSPYCRAGRP